MWVRMVFKGSEEADLLREVSEEGNDEEYDKDDEQYFGNLCCGSCNAAEAEDCCEDSHYEEDECPSELSARVHKRKLVDCIYKF